MYYMYYYYFFCTTDIKAAKVKNKS